MASPEFCAGPGNLIAQDAFRAVTSAAGDLWAKREPSNVPGFSIAHEGTRWFDGVICVWEDATGKLVGGQGNGVPYVVPEYRGRKLGTEIQLRAFDTGLKTIHDGAFFSPEGLGARKSAHRFAVQRALRKGLNVPSEVLADYPELAPGRAMGMG